MCNKKRTNEEFVSEVFNLVGDEYIFLEEYVNTNTKIKVRHNNESCNYYEYHVRPNDFINKGSRCPKCSGVAKKTHEDFIKEVYELVGNEYEVVSRYLNAKTKVIFRHINNECEHNEFKMKPNQFLNGQRCPLCAKEEKRKKKAYSNEDFKLLLHEEFNGEYVTSDEYFNNITVLTFTNTKCGHSFSTTWKSLLRYKKCFICAKQENTIRKTRPHEEIVEEMLNLVGSEYSIISKYEHSDKKIKVKHNNIECDYHEYEVYWYNFKAGHRCPKCSNISKGEREIATYLKDSEIKYTQQFKLDDCRNSQVLPFDFGILDESDNLLCLLEYDGQQHFKPVQFGGITKERAEENLLKTQLNDSIKNEYCKSNNIPLIRIPYWDFDRIEDILNDKLKQFVQ